MKKLALLLAVLLAFSLAGCNNANPGIKNNSSESISGEQGSESNKSIPEYINADALARRSYELRYLLGQEKFTSPDDISPSALVQFAFCHIYYENLTDMPSSGNKLRTASADDIKLQILKYFGSVSVDITKADLYNSGKKQFEMWEPHYGTEIYYDTEIKRAGTDTYKVTAVFYSDEAKTEKTGKTVLTVEDSSGRAIIKKMTSSK